MLGIGLLIPQEDQRSGGSTNGWVLSGAALDFDFANGLYFGGTIANTLTLVRTTQKTDLLPSSAAGLAYNTFGTGVFSITPGLGLLIEETRTNVLLNSTVPVTQTTASLGVGTWVLWVNGTGSATASAGTATVTNAGTAINSSPNVFQITVAGTVTVTVSGSLNAFQLELCSNTTTSFGTSLIVTAGTTATRNLDNIQAKGAMSTLFQATPGSVRYSTTLVGFPTLGRNPRFVGQQNTVFTDWASIGSSQQVTQFNGTNSVNAGFVNPISVTYSMLGWDGTGRILGANGLAPVSDGNSIGAPSTPALGCVNPNNGGAAQLDGYISRLTLWNNRQTSTQIQAFTTLPVASQATALFARMSPSPSALRATVMNNLISALVSTGVWQKLDTFYVLANFSQQASFLNWTQNQYNLSGATLPTFTIDQGINGNGTTQFLDSGFDPGTAVSPNYTLNNASMFVRSNTNSRADGASMLGNLNNGGVGTGANINPWNLTLNNGSYALNSVNVNTLTPNGPTAKGMFLTSRSVAPTHSVYQDSVFLGTVTSASASAAGASFWVGGAQRISAGTSAFSARQVSFAGWGSFLTSQDVINLQTAVQAYMNAIGLS